MGEQRRILEHEADPAGLRRAPDASLDVAPEVAIEPDDPGIGPLQTRDLAQDGRLAGARRSKQHQHRPGPEIDVETRVDREAAGKPLRDRDAQRRGTRGQ
jgi:hypothetical protein